MAAMLSSLSSLAILQPMVPVREDASFRLCAGFNSSTAVRQAVFTTSSSVHADMSIKEIGGGLSFTHFFGHDLFYGLGLNLGVGSVKGFPFENDGKLYRGMRIDSELSFGYLPELARRFHLGPVLKVGYGRQAGDIATKAREQSDITFGDLSLKAGLNFSIGFSDWAAMYFTPSYTLTSVRFFGERASEKAKAEANASGMEIPLGVHFNFTQTVGMFVETNSKFLRFKDLGPIGPEGLGHNWRQELSLGLSITL